MPKACKVPASGFGGREIQIREDQRGNNYVKQEIISLDDRSDGAGDDRAAQLPALLGLGKRTRRDPGCRHRISSQVAERSRKRPFFGPAPCGGRTFFSSANLTASEQRRKRPTPGWVTFWSRRQSATLLLSIEKGWRAREEFEPLTPRSVVWCSIQLSYGRMRPSEPALAAPTTTPAATEKARRIAATRAPPCGRWSWRGSPARPGAGTMAGGCNQGRSG